MQLICENKYLWMSGPLPKFVKEAISYQVEGRWFVPSFKRGTWDGWVTFAKKVRGKELYYIPSGFLAKITKVLDDNEWNYSLDDRRDPCVVVEPVYELNDGTKLHDYQRNAADTFFNNGRGIIKIGTGGGKTVLAAALIKAIGSSTIWLTHRRRLMYQTQRVLQRCLGCEIGIIGDSESHIKPITVGMVQSCDPTRCSGEITEFIRSCGFIIGDEVHHLQAEGWIKVFEECPAIWRLGLTATPIISGPGMALIAHTGNILVDIPAIELIERGFLVPPRIWIAKFDNLVTVPKNAKYPEIYKTAIVDNIKRNELIKDIAKIFRDEGKSCLILVKQVRHGELLTDFLNFFNVKTEYIQGSVSEDERDKIFENMFSGRLHCVVATAQIFGEGADLPPLRALINATGTYGGGNRSEDEEAGYITLQMIGRGLRKAPGKKYFDYIDISDYAHRTLRHATLGRVETLEAEGYNQYIRWWHQYVIGNDDL